MTGIVALYIFMLAAFTGYEVIAKVPVILHTPLMSGSNFVHGIVLVGAMVALGNATTTLEKSIGFFGVLLAAGNAVGGYAVTERMLEMFKASGARGKGSGGKDAALAIDWQDEVFAQSCLTHAGAIKHEPTRKLVEAT